MYINKYIIFVVIILFSNCNEPEPINNSTGYIDFKKYLDKLEGLLNHNSKEKVKRDILNSHKTFRLKILRNLVKKYSPYLGDLRSKFINKPLGVMKFIEKINIRYIEKSLIDVKEKEKLDDEFFLIIKELEDVINKDLSHWYE